MSQDSSRPVEPEYLGEDPPAPSGGGRSRRTPVLGLSAAAVVGLASVGGWAAVSLMSGGAQPAEAVPANALAYVSLDLDPSASQKLEAIRILEKFPVVDEELGLDATDDLRKWVFSESDLSSCTGVDYEKDVAPWIGKRAALAVLPAANAKGTPDPVMALQVTDPDKAAASLEKLVACDTDQDDQKAGFAVGEGYVLLAENDAKAQAAVDAAAEASLVDDATFQRWTEAAGDPGILTMYVAPGAPAALAKLGQVAAADEDWLSGRHDEVPEDLVGNLAQDDSPAIPVVPGMGMGGEQLQRLTKDFEGMAVVLRFEDGTVEAEFAGGGLPEGTAPDPGAVTAVGELPATTGAAISIAFPDGWLAKYLDSMDAMSGGMPLDQMLAEAEAQTGLSLPEDAETLLGDSTSIAVDGGIEAGRLIESEDPSNLPAGVRVVGDPEQILPVVEKIKRSLGPASDMLVVEPGDGAVALGFDQEYVERLAGRGDLGSDASFKAAVPEADRAAGVVYVNFDTGDAWVERLVEDFSQLAEGRSDPKVRENLEALEALGISTWVDDGVQRGLFRLTTD